MKKLIMKKLMIKEKMILLLGLLLLLLPFTAAAESKKEWELTCDAKLAENTTIYAIDIAADGTKTARAIGSLPAGTYFRVNSKGFDEELQLKMIRYYQNGEQSAYMARSAPIASASKIIWFTDGTMTHLPENVVADPAELRSWLNTTCPGHTVYAISNVGQASPLEFPQTFDGTQTTILTSDQAAAVNPGGTPRPYTGGTAKDPSVNTSGYVEGEWNISTEISAEEQAFNASCPHRLKRTVWGYSDAHMTSKYEKINIGTYVNIMTDFNDVVKIAYYKNGVRHTAYVERADLLGAYTQYVDRQGNAQTVYTGDPDYEAILSGCEVTFQAESITQGLDTLVAEEQNRKNTPAKASAESNGAAHASQEAASTASGSEGEKVVVNRVGVSTTMIAYQGETMEVRTAQLTFSKNVPS